MSLFVPGASRPWLRLSMNAGQSLSSGAATKLSFDTVSANGGGWVAPVAPVADIVMPYTGIVLVNVHDIDWTDAGNGTGYRGVFLRKNDVAGSSRAFALGPPNLAAANNNTAQSGATVASVVAGDTLQIYGRQTSGGALSPGLNDLFLLYLDLGSFPFSGTN